MMAQATPAILIKRYGGRRLYDTHAGRYVTLEGIADLVRGERRVIVQDAKTGEDITPAVLGEIIAGDA